MNAGTFYSVDSVGNTNTYDYDDNDDDDYY